MNLYSSVKEGMQAFEMRCYPGLLKISYNEHVTNEEIRRKMQASTEEHDELLVLNRNRKYMSKTGVSGKLRHFYYEKLKSDPPTHTHNCLKI